MTNLEQKIELNTERIQEMEERLHAYTQDIRATRLELGRDKFLKDIKDGKLMVVDTNLNPVNIAFI